MSKDNIINLVDYENSGNFDINDTFPMLGAIEIDNGCSISESFDIRPHLNIPQKEAIIQEIIQTENSPRRLSYTNKQIVNLCCTLLYWHKNQNISINLL